MKLQPVQFYTGVMAWQAVGLVLLQSACGQKIPAKQLREDFQIMRRTLEAAHGGIYRYASKVDMDRAFDRACKEIDHPMTALAFWGLVAPVVAHIRDGHLFTLWPKDVPWTQAPLLPLTVRVFDSRLFVYRDFSTDEHQLEGGEILSINGVSAKHILEKMSARYTGEGNSRSAVPYRIGHYDIFMTDLYLLMKIESPFHVVYRNARGESKGVQLMGKNFADLQAGSAARDPEPKTSADLKFLDHGNIAVLTIRSFSEYVDLERKVTLCDFLQTSFEQIHQEKSSNLIIDVRDNSGGQDASGVQLFSYLWDRPFAYYKDKVINAREFEFFKYAPDAKPVPANLVEKRADGKFHYLKEPGLGLQQPRQPHFGGKVFALMNGGTFSTSCEFLSMLPFHKRGTLIGEEAAGGYYGCTAGFRLEIILPHSKVRLPLGMITYYYAAADYEHADRSMIPDYPVLHSIGDLLAGRDKDMELALALARAK
jgi:hypothetical protein